MKKIYTKPEIVFEDFSLSTNIAGDCEPPYVNNSSKGSCAMVGTGGIMVFTEGVIYACEYDSTDLGGGKDEYNGFCYFVPTAESNLFNS